MRKPLAEYSGEERRQIALLANRSVSSEVRLILGGGFSVIMILSSLLSEFTFLPVAEAIGLRPTLVWVAMSFVLAVIWAKAHASKLGPRIAAARDLEAAFLYEHETRVLRENRAKARNLRQDQ